MSSDKPVDPAAADVAPQDPAPSSLAAPSPAKDKDHLRPLAPPADLEMDSPSQQDESAQPSLLGKVASDAMDQPITRSVDPAQVPLPSSPFLAPSSPKSVMDRPNSLSPLVLPPLAPPPRSRARPSPSGSGQNSPAASRKDDGSRSPAPSATLDVVAAPEKGVAKALDYGDGDASSLANVPLKSEMKQEDGWSTPTLPSFRDDVSPPLRSTATSPAPPSDDFAIPHVPAQPLTRTAPAPTPTTPALPPRTSSLGATASSPSSPSAWTLPARRPSPSPTPSALLRPPPSPAISDDQATGPLPKRRSSSGVYTPASFAGPSPRKASAPAAINRPPPLPTTGTYRKVSEGTGLGFVISTGSESSVSSPPASAPAAAATGGWGLWSSARSYFSAQPPSTSDASSQSLASSPLTEEPSPALVSALFPSEDDTLLPTGSLSPTGVYSPYSFYEQQQQHLLSLRPGSTTPTLVQAAFVARSPPTSPRASMVLNKSPSTARKPAPMVVEDGTTGAADRSSSFSATVSTGPSAPARKPVPTYSHDTMAGDDDDGKSETEDEEVNTTAGSHSPPSSFGPSTPAWEQPEVPPSVSMAVRPPSAVDERDEYQTTDKQSSGLAGFGGFGKEMQVLEVAMPLDEAQDGQATRVW